MRSAGQKRTPLEVVEALAAARFGPAAAVSVDRRRGGFVVTAWAADGVEHVSTEPARTTAAAVSTARRMLARKEG
jgi:hypothetical protein